jgi:hypothetical protein
MTSWILSCICTLILSYFLKWTSHEFFSAACLFAIFLEISFVLNYFKLRIDKR